MNTTQAAGLAGLTPAAFRRAMTRERDRGNDMRLPPDRWTDQRTPEYDNRKIKAWTVKRAEKKRQGDQ